MVLHFEVLVHSRLIKEYPEGSVFDIIESIPIKEEFVFYDYELLRIIDGNLKIIRVPHTTEHGWAKHVVDNLNPTNDVFYPFLHKLNASEIWINPYVYQDYKNVYFSDSKYQSTQRDECIKLMDFTLREWVRDRKINEIIK